ncbi:hypothetical protein [Legionella nagasakiensis]|uniref:hypothetical protein n=1 Tax=Legionella nagasakiensis TaxID=535290 RepID=UPI001055F0D8|nr:hypothetical protein [Legionella nagasakiensis]
MLCELFSWVNSRDGSMEAIHGVVARDAFRAEQALALAKRRELVAKLRVLRYESPSDSTAIAEALRQIEIHESFLVFIRFCERKLETHDTYSLIQLGLEYVLSLEADALIDVQKNEQCARLFQAFLVHEKERACAFYEENKPRLNKVIHEIMAVERVKAFLADLSDALMHQREPKGVAHLFKGYIDDTEKLAASVLWLVQRGVSAEDIIKTGLLHDFMLYHLSYLHDSDSPVSHLYALLNHFPEARTLIEEAAKVRCEDRGFQRYALTGVLSEEELESVESQMCPAEFTAASENFTVLYRLFEEPFLYTALAWYAKTNDEVCAAFLRETLNQTFHPEQLSTLINGIASISSPELLEKLASLLEDETLERLVSLQHGSVFHLVAYKPSLCHKISTIDIRDYLQKMPAGASSFESISQLMALFAVFRNIHSSAAVPVFEAIIDKLLLHPEFMDDYELVMELRKFAKKNTIIADKLSRLEALLDECIAVQTLTAPFMKEQYYAIEDTWYSVARQITSLREILPLPSHYPHDKYALQAYVAKVFWARHPGEFVLSDFIQAFEIEPSLEADEINAYERILIEIMTTVDDAALRADVIRILAGKYTDNEWISQNYGGVSLFNRVIRQGNVGCLAWLIEVGHIEPSRFAVRSIVVQAVECAQWNVVEFFCRTMPETLDRHTIKKLFKQAAEYGELGCVQLIHEKASRLLDKRSIEQAFKEAVGNGHLSVVQFLCGLERSEAPCDAVQVKGFKQALASNQLAMTHYLASMPENRLMQQEVELALIEFSGKNDVVTVRSLCSLTEHAPRQVAIERACEKAASQGSYDALVYLCGLPENAPRLRTVENALRLAGGKGQVREVDALCHLPLNPPRLCAIEQVFIGAANTNDQEMVRYFCSQEALLSRKAVDLGLQAAAKAGHLAIVQDIYRLTPSAKAVRYALHKASSAGHGAIVEFLRHPVVSITAPRSETKPVIAAPRTPQSAGTGLATFGLFSPEASLRRVMSYGCELSRLKTESPRTPTVFA